MFQPLHPLQSDNHAKYEDDIIFYHPQKREIVKYWYMAQQHTMPTYHTLEQITIQQALDYTQNYCK